MGVRTEGSQYAATRGFLVCFYFWRPTFLDDISVIDDRRSTTSHLEKFRMAISHNVSTSCLVPGLVLGVGGQIQDGGHEIGAIYKTVCLRY